MPSAAEKKHPNEDDLRCIKTRALINGTFRKLLETTEFPDITVSLIAREAQISRKTFYAHYATTTDLLLELAAEEIARTVGTIQTSGEALSIEEWLREFNRQVLVTFRDNPHLNAHIIRRLPMASIVGIVQEPLRDIYVTELTRRGFTRIPDIEPIITFYVGGICSAFELWAASSGSDAELAETADLVGKAITEGFSALLEA